MDNGAGYRIDFREIKLGYSARNQEIKKEDTIMALHRMRTIPEALEEIRALDERSAISPYCLRMLCRGKHVRCIYTGRKILVDLDDLIRFLNNSEYIDIQESTYNQELAQEYAI